MQSAYILIIVCGVLALLYGMVTARQVLAADAGNARMQEIAAAVQEGAAAYLNRQYTTIGIVGLIILVILWITLGMQVAIGFLIGAVLSSLAGYVGTPLSQLFTTANRIWSLGASANQTLFAGGARSSARALPRCGWQRRAESPRPVR